MSIALWIRLRRAAIVATGLGACALAWPATGLASSSDVFLQTATLTPTGAHPSNDSSEPFGTSLALSANGRVLAVGAPSAAQLRVFVRPPDGSWKNAHQSATLFGYTNSDFLGESVAVSANGSTIVAGAPAENGEAGEVYVYLEPPGGWRYANELPTMAFRASDSTGLDALGTSVAVSADGSTIVAGAPGWNADEGAIYLFTRASGGWRKTAPQRPEYLHVNEPGAGGCCGGQFGESVAMSADGRTIVVGAPNEEGNEGAVYVVKRPSGQYHELHDPISGTLDPYWLCSTSTPYGAGNPILGLSVAVSANGHTIASGMPCAGFGGEAVVYTEPAGGWLNASSNFTAGLTPLGFNARLIQNLGANVALAGDGKTLIASDPGFNAYPGPYVAWFREPKRGWAHVNPPLPANFGSVFGQTPLAGAIAIGSIGGTIFVGGTGHRNEGAVYVFNETTSGGTPIELSCSPSPVRVGKASTCTVTVSDPRKGGLVPRGTVKFTSGGTSGQFSHNRCQLKVKSRKAAAASCSVKFTALSPLGYTIAARYTGDVHHRPATGVATLGTTRSATTIAVSCAPASLKVDATSTCTATADGVGSLPPATIVFQTKDGGKATGEKCTPSPGTQVCTASFSASSPGTYQFAAIYPGDAEHKPSHSQTSVTVTS